jgi:hypothetical protein
VSASVSAALYVTKRLKQAAKIVFPMDLWMARGEEELA